MVNRAPGVAIEIFNLEETGCFTDSVGVEVGLGVDVAVGLGGVVAVGVSVAPGGDVAVGVASSPQATINNKRMARAGKIIRFGLNDFRVTYPMNTSP